MKFEIIPKSDIIPSYDPNAVAVKYIEDNSHGEQYEEDEITPDLMMGLYTFSSLKSTSSSCATVSANSEL